MIEVGSNAKIQIHWKVNPYDYSIERRNSLISQISTKYNIPKDKVKIIPNFIMLNEKGEKMNISNDLLMNIQNPEFQITLFEEYLKVNNIEGYDFDFIKKIDSVINGKLDYKSFDKYRQYSIKWIKWSNFLSYGKDNFYDFSKLSGLVLLNGEPANQSGKTTFAIDLFRFLLFGKTNRYKTQDKIFNRWLKQETELVVEGCIEIDGEEYVIKRTLTRPQYKKRTANSKTTQKLEYYKIVAGNLEELEDYVENQQEENTAKTNKIIKESIGSENDFDMIICATSKNLSDLIDKNATDRGRILSRWIGLSPLEEKEILAKEQFNSEIKPYLYSNQYNVDTLLRQRECLILQNKDYEETIKKITNDNIKISKEIETIENNKNLLMSAKQSINTDVEKIDITTLLSNISTITENGKRKKIEYERIKELIDSLGEINFSETEYDHLISLKTANVSKLSEIKSECKFLQKSIHDLKNSEYCPTCGRKYENVDNTDKINELNSKLNELIQLGVETNNSIKEFDEKINLLKELREKFKLKSENEIKKASIEVQLERLRSELIEKNNLKKEYEKNKDIINKNNEIDLNIRNYDVQLKGYYNTKETNISYISSYKSKQETISTEITKCEEMVLKLQEEEKVLKNWKIYLDMIGKNGISKMVLRKALPILNAQLKHLLNDVCDFDVEIEINDKNEISFNLIKDEEKLDISGGSGFEQTASALALRFVLAKNSVIPKLNYIVLDELFGLVADDNLDKMRTLLDNVKDDYTSTIIVTHKNIVKEWCNTIITVTKEDNVSKIVTKHK